MSMKVSKAMLLAGVLSFAFSLLGCSKREALRVDSQALPNTKIPSHMEENIVPGKNLIYCATFQLAWNELRDNIIKEDVRLTDEPLMVQVLNKKKVTSDDISEDCYVAMAGFGRDRILERINEALQLKFQDQAPTVEEYLESEWIFAYAFLLKELMFETSFESLKEPLRFESGAIAADVKAFGIDEFQPNNERHVQLAKQVSVVPVIYRKPEFITRGFIVSLTSRTPNDEIVLARVEPRQTLLETVRSVQETLESRSPVSLGRDDTLHIPKFNFDITHSYSELIEKFFLNRGFASYYIKKARQDIRFRLSEKGAMLKSEARMVATGMPKWLVFDQPFLLYLKEKHSQHPYFAIWVEHPEILVK